jgi:hypothetical protein
MYVDINQLTIFPDPCFILQDTPVPSATDSVVSDDEGVVVSKEEVEESINKAVVRTHASLFGTINAQPMLHFSALYIDDAL